MTFGVEGLDVRFGDVEALRDVTLDIPAGEVTAIVGGDGAGKTTLLRTLAGLVEPARGIVRRPGSDRLGFVPTGAGSWTGLTVGENVEFVGGAYGFGPVDAARRAGPLLERAGLSGVVGRLAGDLSGGMRTKLGFVLAAMHDPNLLILDEPTTGVDPVSRVELWRMISGAVAGGTAVVMSTTYLDEAERTAAVTLLDRGTVLLSGPPGELIDAMLGAITVADTPTDRARAWRLGPVFHEWLPPGTAAGGRTVEPTLDDACIVAQIAARERVPGGAP